jgi:hypothetical protein
LTLLGDARLRPILFILKVPKSNAFPIGIRPPISKIPAHDAGQHLESFMYTRSTAGVARFVAFALSALALSGCSTSFNPALTPGTSSLGKLQGMVHGGQQPVVGAKVYVYAAGTTGNGGLDASGSRIYGTTSNASISLLNSSVLTNNPSSSGLDKYGNYYVTTATDGSFSINGDYTCTQGQQIYLYVTGGNPGAGTNSKASFLSVLGACPAAGNLAATVPYVWINEVSTVAAAYALAGFASDPTHISSDAGVTGNTSAAQAASGIANAFANAAMLVSTATGNAVTTTANGGTAPTAAVNTLANILAACVNSSPDDTTNCDTLFGAAISDGTSGSWPTDTATAAINIAHHPAVNVSTLFGLQAGVGSPFAPNLTTVSDFTLAVKFPSTTISYVSDIKFDASGNAWIASGSTVSNLTPQGAYTHYLSGTNGLNTPRALSVDASGNAWVGNQSDGNYVAISPTGTFLNGSTPWTAISGGSTWFSAVDINGNIWLDDKNHGTLYESNPSGTLLISALAAGGYSVDVDAQNRVWSNAGSTVRVFQNGVAVTGSPFTTHGGVHYSHGSFDAAGNYWTVNPSSNSIYAVSSTGVSLFPSGITATGLVAPYSPVIDGSGRVWVANNYANATLSGVHEFTSTGTLLSPAAGFVGNSTSYNNNEAIAVDGSGNLWIGGHFYVSIMIGAATPVVNPMVTAASLGKFATRP